MESKLECYGLLVILVDEFYELVWTGIDKVVCVEASTQTEAMVCQEEVAATRPSLSYSSLQLPTAMAIPQLRRA